MTQLKIDKGHKSLIVVIAVLVILVLATYIYFNSKSDKLTNREIVPSEIAKNAGIKEVVNLGDLSFKLVEAGLFKEEVVYTPLSNAVSYHMILTLDVTNNGNKVQNVSYYCGKLLFEDNSQYNFDITQGGLCETSNDRNCLRSMYLRNYYDLTGICHSVDILPGAKISINDEFYFSDTYYIDKTLAWEQVPGSKITYFSQQNDGLLRFVINKDEIILGNSSDLS